MVLYPEMESRARHPPEGEVHSQVFVRPPDRGTDPARSMGGTVPFQLRIRQDQYFAIRLFWNVNQHIHELGDQLGNQHFNELWNE